MGVGKMLLGKWWRAVAGGCVLACALVACRAGRLPSVLGIPVPDQPVFLVQDAKEFFDTLDRSLGFSREFSQPLRRAGGRDDEAVDEAWMAQLRRQAQAGMRRRVTGWAVFWWRTGMAGGVWMRGSAG